MSVLYEVAGAGNTEMCWDSDGSVSHGHQDRMHGGCENIVTLVDMGAYPVVVCVSVVFVLRLNIWTDWVGSWLPQRTATSH